MSANRFRQACPGKFPLYVGPRPWRDLMPDLLHPDDKGYGLWYDTMPPTLGTMMK